MTSFGDLRSDRLQNIPAMLSDYSGRRTASAQLHTGKSVLTYLKILTDDVNDVTVIVFDSVGAGDDDSEVDRFVVPAAERYGGACYGLTGPKLNSGLYISLSGANGSYQAHYAPAT